MIRFKQFLGLVICSLVFNSCDKSENKVKQVRPVTEVQHPQTSKIPFCENVWMSVGEGQEQEELINKYRSQVYSHAVEMLATRRIGLYFQKTSAKGLTPPPSVEKMLSSFFQTSVTLL